MRRCLTTSIVALCVSLIAAPALASADVDHRNSNDRYCVTIDLPASTVDVCSVRQATFQRVTTPSGHLHEIWNSQTDYEYVRTYDDGSQYTRAYTAYSRYRWINQDGQSAPSAPPYGPGDPVSFYASELHSTTIDDGVCLTLDSELYYKSVNGEVMVDVLNVEAGEC